ncbi:MAG: hypothetical protein FJ390_05565 [Verrucomicrobia bacterium]|nr:hypothetical protein [Verrucomicrobiota bacterium]
MSPLPPPSPFFLGWDNPWLPRLAQHLLLKSADLSKTVVILPGRRAGRRLLELLALQAQENAQLFFPPSIMTLEEAVHALLEIPTALPVAPKSISRLAWRQAALQLTLQELQDIQSMPKGMITSAITEARHRVAALGERLALELGKAGFLIEEVLFHHTPFFPESADREEPRWKALACLQKEYQKALSRWGYTDCDRLLKQKLQQGEYCGDKRIVVAGVVDFPPLFFSFFEKINPEIMIIAPESHATGFDRYGKIIPSYWLENPAEVPEKILISCERSRDQAAQTWEIIAQWQKTTPQNSVVIVAPEIEALSLLREAGAAMGFQTRWAGGRPFQGSSLFLLIEAFQKFLDRAPGTPPSLAAVADLLRHPTVATKLTHIFHGGPSPGSAQRDAERADEDFGAGLYSTHPPSLNRNPTQSASGSRKPPQDQRERCGLNASLPISSELLIRELDDWEREHLALFLEENHLKQFHKEETLGALLKKLEKHFAFALEPEPLERVLQQWRNMLVYLFGQEKARRTDPEEHFFLACFEKLLLLLEELEELAAYRVDAGSSLSRGRPSTLDWSASELLSFLLEMLSKESIPELEQTQAIEIIGWLEAAAEDVPALVLTSCHEGAIPTAAKSDPFLSERVRKKLGLLAAEDQLARDHYYLQLILHSRKKEGGVAILAPRYNGRDEPVRPSRLLLQGCAAAALPDRVLSLTQQQTTGYRLQATGIQDWKNICSSNKDHLADQQTNIDKARITTTPQLLRPATCNLQPVTCNVTSLRTYLRSPRLFYLQHVLKLREVLEAPVEMTASLFGVLLHRILANFSAEASLREEKKESIFCNWLEKALERTFQSQFGKKPSPAVSSQQGEVWRALKGFARAEAAHRAEGWKTIAVEGKSRSSSLLEEKIVLDDNRSLILQGRIDRLDWHPEKKRWLLLDYKTSHHQEWKKETPNHTHFRLRGETVFWHDLQLPLYLKLAPQLAAVQESELPLPTIENTDLCFFQLPIHPEAAGISEPFDSTMIQPAWEEAQRLIELILDGRFEEVGMLDSNISPTWKALCRRSGC